MPNWIEGTLKLRGNSEDLKRFFAEGLEPSTDHGEELDKNVTLEDFVKWKHYACCDICDDIEIHNQPHIIGTRRAFIYDCDVCWVGSNDEIDTICMPFKQAWSFSATGLEQWEDISKKFNLDIRLYGFESGMEFCEEVEIIKGKTTLHNVIKYNDWYWECPMPLMGG